MTRTIVVDALVATGILLLLVCAAGLLTMRSAYDRLHYSNAASWGVVLLALAILVRESWSLIADKALAIAFVLAVCSPAIAHATARAGRIREHGAWNVSRRESGTSDASRRESRGNDASRRESRPSDASRRESHGDHA